MERTQAFPSTGNSNLFSKEKQKVYCSVNQHERHVTWLRIKNIMTFFHSCQARWNTFESDRPRTLSELVAYSRRRLLEAQSYGGASGILACEQGLLFGQAKRLHRSLARSREPRFTRPNIPPKLSLLLSKISQKNWGRGAGKI